MSSTTSLLESSGVALRRVIGRNWVADDFEEAHIGGCLDPSWGVRRDVWGGVYTQDFAAHAAFWGGG